MYESNLYSQKSIELQAKIDQLEAELNRVRFNYRQAENDNIEACKQIAELRKELKRRDD